MYVKNGNFQIKLNHIQVILLQFSFSSKWRNSRQNGESVLESRAPQKHNQLFTATTFHQMLLILLKYYELSCKTT